MHFWATSGLPDETVANALLLHTVGGVAELTVTLILLRALYLLWRSGEMPRGFFAIALLMLLASATRAVRLALAWAGLRPSQWFEAVTGGLLFVTVLAIPVILSAHYLPLHAARGLKPARHKWIHWFMVWNAVIGVLAFIASLLCGWRDPILLIPAVTCTVSAVLLYMRASLHRNLQLRQRGLLLFSWLTSLGLFGISINILYGYWYGMWKGMPLVRTVVGTTSAEACNMLIVLGMMCVFANLRLADVIVKRVVRVYILAIVSLGLWASGIGLARLSVGAVDQRTGFALISVVLIGLSLVIIPGLVHVADDWIGRWIFQVPDFDAAIQSFWEQLLDIDNEKEVYGAGEQVVRETLCLASVTIADADELSSGGIRLPQNEPNPRFLSSKAHSRSAVTSSADVLVPLFHDSVPKHWIVLSHGAIRPPLTGSELGFVTRIAGAIQVRIGTFIGEQRRLERLTREAAYREELAEAELRALRAQINPHFLFNSLNTIADLSLAAPERAEEMTLRLAAVFRYVLANTDRQFTSVREEISFAQSYLGIEEARFGNRLKVQFEVDPSVLQERLPALLLQPLIENALKHGVGPKREGGTLSIEASRTTTGFFLKVSDDGIGLPGAQKGTPPRGSAVGLENVRKRLVTAYQGRATFTLKSRVGGGTEAIVTIHTEGGIIV